MLRYDDDARPLLDCESLERIVNMLHEEGKKSWDTATNTKSEAWKKGEDFHKAAAELERAYYRIGVRI